MSQIKPIKANLPNHTFQTKPTKPNLPNQTYQTKPNQPNQTYQTKLTKPSLPNQNYPTKPTTPKLLVKVVNAWVRSTFGNVLKQILRDPLTLPSLATILVFKQDRRVCSFSHLECQDPTRATPNAQGHQRGGMNTLSPF